MHSYIYQVSRNPIDREDWIADEGDVYSEELMDYCSLEYDRGQAISFFDGCDP